MGDVILGRPGPWAEDTLEPSDHYTTKIGGVPDFPFSKESMRPQMLQCSTCGSDLCLITQVYAPYSGVNLKIEERVIYVFGCARLRCVCWRAIRVQKSENIISSITVTQKAPSNAISSESISNMKWLEHFSDDDDDMNPEELGRALSQASSFTFGSVKKSAKKNFVIGHNLESFCSGFMKAPEKNSVLPCFYIYTVPEKSSKDEMSICSSYSSLSIKEKVNNDIDQLAEEVWEPEGYEYDRALNADRTYLKFKKQIDAYPDQCFRYFYGGKPLLATVELGDAGICGLCGGSRHYEMQVMPPLLYFLQEAATGHQKDLLDNWNWMTLIVYTCAKSCFRKTNQDSSDWDIAEEAVLAQYENP